jgi:hypothetical protein
MKIIERFIQRLASAVRDKINSDLSFLVLCFSSVEDATRQHKGIPATLDFDYKYVVRISGLDLIDTPHEPTY